MRLPGVVAFFVTLALAQMPAYPVMAHPGGLNAEGCHTNHRTGEYHCHRPSRDFPQSLRSAQPLNSYSGVSFPNCAAARAAGAAPVRAGDPGYSRRLDRDGDGVGCE
jgi:hypothetical protein